MRTAVARSAASPDAAVRDGRRAMAVVEVAVGDVEAVARLRMPHEAGLPEHAQVLRDLGLSQPE